MSLPTKPIPRKNAPRWIGPTGPARIPLIPSISAARWLLLLIAASGVYFFHGFLIPVLAALVIGFASWPLYRRLLTQVGGSTTVAATIALVLIIGFIVLPLSFAVHYTSGEVKEWLAWALRANREGAPTPQWILALPLAGPHLDELWTKYIGTPGAMGEVIQAVSGAHLGNIYRAVVVAGGNAFHLLLTMLFMLIALFFVYRDGSTFSQQVDLLGERILPGRWKRISRVVPATISSTVVGMTLIALGEGIVLGVAYWIAGVPSPVTLGVITGIMALIPGGAPLSFTLVSIYLLASGSHVAGIALFTWGTVELFIVDKTLRPRLVGGPIKLPFLPTFFGLVGGVKTMGFLGLFIGPVLMALLVAIWREWLHDIAETPEDATTEVVIGDATLPPRRLADGS